MSHQTKLDALHLLKKGNLGKQTFSGEYLYYLVENAGDGIISISKEGIIISWNHCAEKIFGYSSAEAIGQNIDIIVPQDKMDEKQLLLDKVILKGEVVKRFETERIRKDGKKVVINATISPIKDKSGSIIGASEIFRTLTEEEFMRKRISHFEKLISMGKLAAEIAHQVNSPLGAVMGRIQLILKNIDKFDKKMFTNNLEQMLSSCDHIRIAIGSLLDYTRRIVTKEPVDINNIIDDTLKMMSHRLMIKGITVHKRFTENLPSILGIGGELIHVFVNIISNAIDAMDNGGRLEVITDIVKSSGPSLGKQVRITISDNGHGINEQNINRIFTPFFTTKDVGKGTGLGLSVVKRIVKMHKGNLDVLSKHNQGTSFIFSFPVLSDNEKTD